MSLRGGDIDSKLSDYLIDGMSVSFYKMFGDRAGVGGLILIPPSSIDSSAHG